MRKFVAIWLLICAAALLVAAQENDLKIPAEVAPFIEKDTKAVALEMADLNGDGTQDFILVLEKLGDETDETTGSRSLLILARGADNQLTLAKRNDKGLIFCRECGGIFGDPFENVEVKPKSFTVNLYGGSNWRWIFRYKFAYSRIDKTWQLVRVEESTFYAPEAEKIKTEIYTPPKHFGKIDIADFDPDDFLNKSVKPKK